MSSDKSQKVVVNAEKKRPYSKPEIAEEQTFERKAILACLKAPGRCAVVPNS